MPRINRIGVCGQWLVMAFLTALVAAGVSSAQAGGRVNIGYFGGVAIMGYDSVAYFEENRAVKGSPEFKHEFLGETWHFASAAHRDAFAANPVAYAPQFGGYCSGELLLAEVSSGITTNIDPNPWRIIEGKLYLFYDRGTAELFEQNAEEWIKQANAQWPTVESRLVAE